MPMMFVRRVLVGMLKWRMTMPVGVWLADGIQRSMLMPMVLVMCV